jgi:hypothetical protein
MVIPQKQRNKNCFFYTVRSESGGALKHGVGRVVHVPELKEP